MKQSYIKKRETIKPHSLSANLFVISILLHCIHARISLNQLSRFVLRHPQRLNQLRSNCHLIPISTPARNIIKSTQILSQITMQNTKRMQRTPTPRVRIKSLQQLFLAAPFRHRPIQLCKRALLQHHKRRIVLINQCPILFTQLKVGQFL